MRVKSKGCVTIADVQKLLQEWYKAKVTIIIDGIEKEYTGWVSRGWARFDDFWMELENGKILWISGKQTTIVEEI